LGKDDIGIQDIDSEDMIEDGASGQTAFFGYLFEIFSLLNQSKRRFESISLL
jgi:hypothetical protein